MKKITLFLFALLISCSAWGAKIYLKPNSNWATDNARFAAYFFSNGEKWVSMTPVFDAYEVDVPSGFSKVIFCRMNPSNTTNGWNNKYNQTGDLSIPNNANNCFTVPNGAWDGSTTSWGEYNYSDLYVAGTMNNWSTTEDKLVYSSDKSSASFSKDLEPGDYEFKISRGAWDWSKGAEIFDKDNSDVINANTKDNVKFNLQNKANVKFILSKEQKISVQLFYDVDVTAGTGGTVSGGGENIRHNTAPEIKATANAGYEFVGWYNESNELISRDATYEPTVTSNLNLTAKFQHANVTFTNQSTLEFATYGKLSYKLEMPNDRWYWIVLPYDVNVFEITTTGAKGNYNDLVFTEYDAQTRAGGGNGWINWKTAGYTIEKQTLTANKGYVIGPKTKKGETYNGITVFFPSAEPTNTVAREATNLTATNTGGTTIDDNWNIIGTGLYHEGSLSDDINYVAIPDNEGDYTYYYVNAPATDIFNNELTDYTFNPFEAFFVQYGGPYSATATDAQSAALAPVARAKAQEQEQIYLINMNEAHTVVILNAEGSEGYTAGEDFLEMNVGSRIEMIYSFDAEDALAFNHRATEAQSIALGGYVAVAGEQTISLDAYNGNAEAVTLIDNVTSTTTDLLAEDYTFTAEVGSLDGRFTIVFAAQKAGSDTTVDCYNSIANQVIAYGTADHCTVSGLTAGEAIVVYNTMGQLVFATTADSETITLPSLTAGNYLILHNGTTNKVTLR